MKNIAYIELDTHAELAANFMELMHDSRVFEVDYYFSEKILKRISERGQNITVSEASTLLDDLQNKQYDLIILGTAHRFFHVFEVLVKRFPTFIIAHNLNFVKASNAQIFSSIWKQDRLYRLKLWLKEGLSSKNKVYEGARGLFVIDENLRDQHAGRQLRWLPLFYTKFTNASPKPNHIVIPGKVDQHRRNYQRIFKKIKSFKDEFSITFLGMAEGHELSEIMKIEQTVSENIDLHHYNTRVSEAEFDQKTLDASALWCPIQEKTEFFSIVEYYGKTKVSGNIGDAIKYAKPAIFPKSYNTSYSFIFKEDIDVESQLKNLGANTYDFDDFEKSLVRKKLENLLLSL